MKKDTFDTIEDYLLENLSEEERTAFEAQLQTDEALAEAVARQRLEHRAMQLSLQDDLRAQMAEWKKEKTGKAANGATQTGPPREAKRITLSSRLTRIALAASILLVVAMVARWAFFNPSLSNEELAAAYYESPPAGIARGTESGPDKIVFDEALAQIQRGAYSEALQSLSNISDSTLLVPVLFQMIDAHYKLGNYQQAADAARNILSISSDPLLEQRAEGLLLINKLAAGQRDAEFESLLQRIVKDENHAWHRKAGELMKRL
ncbi:MAG: hypothetical protein KF852_06155 [Saprospiraceae bacterium]|nr:hypothetical protein [Saprospiraceae bacterium]